MEIQKFYGAMSYYPMTFLDEPLKTEYKYKILTIIKKQMERRIFGDYSKIFFILTIS